MMQVLLHRPAAASYLASWRESDVVVVLADALSGVAASARLGIYRLCLGALVLMVMMALTLGESTARL